MASKRAAIYKADIWNVDDNVASDGSGRPLRNPVRRAFSAEYKLAILAEYDGCSESGEKGAFLRREGLYSSIITDWDHLLNTGVVVTANLLSFAVFWLLKLMVFNRIFRVDEAKEIEDHLNEEELPPATRPSSP
jgi:hypothetical protein